MSLAVRCFMCPCGMIVAHAPRRHLSIQLLIAAPRIDAPVSIHYSVRRHEIAITSRI
jgi:hypothetical protein